MLRYLVVIAISLSCTTLSAGRYISLAPHLTEILFDLGVGSQIVGTVEFSDYPESAKDLPVIGNFQQLNLEAIVAAKPDIIFAWPDGNPELQLQRLEDLGLQVYKSSPANLDKLIEEFIEIGALVNRTVHAESLVKEMRQDIAVTTATYQEMPKVQVFYQVWHQPLRTLGSDPWLNDLLSRCGANNLFAHLKPAYPLVNIEAVVSKQPDLILFPESAGQSGSTELWQQWQSLNAVKQQRLATVNADLLHRFTRRSIDGFKSLCETINHIRRTINDT